MKALIVCYSFTGNNVLVASLLKERLSADMVTLTELRPRKNITILLDLLFGRRAKIAGPSVMPDRYDVVLLLGPVWYATLASPLKAWLELEKSNIRQYGVITVCAGRKGQVDKITRQALRLAEKSPLLVAEWALTTILPQARQAEFKNAATIRIDSSDLSYFEKSIASLVETLQESYPGLAVQSKQPTSAPDIISMN